MIVYGRQDTYETGKKLSKNGLGTIYALKNNETSQAVVFQKAYCNPEKEREVKNALSEGTMIGTDVPIDILYDKGRFVGYLCEKCVYQEEPENQTEFGVKDIHDASPAGLSTQVIMGICFGVGIFFSLLIYYLIYPNLTSVLGESALLNYHGIPMIVGGWVLMLFAVFKIQDDSLRIIAPVVAYILGAALTLVMIVLLTVVLQGVFAVIRRYLLLIVIIIAVFLWIKRKFRVK